MERKIKQNGGWEIMYCATWKEFKPYKDWGHASGSPLGEIKANRTSEVNSWGSRLKRSLLCVDRKGRKGLTKATDACTHEMRFP